MESTTSKELVKGYQKKYGEDIGGIGVTHPGKPRIPSGVFAFDLASGGGFPRGAISIVYGPESSGKTNLALLTIASHQRLFPKALCAFVDLENSVDESWASKLGVDTKKWIFFRPDYAEQAIDIIEGMLYAEDIGLIVLDSAGAMTVLHEIEKSAEIMTIGRGALAVQKLVKKSNTALLQGVKDNRFPTLIMINQVRMKIGVMYGDPEDFPGGRAQKHLSSLTVRLWGKNIQDEKVHPLLPAHKVTKGVIKKWKVPIVGDHFEYKMCMVPHNEVKVSEVDDWKLIAGNLKSFEALTKDGNKWLLFDQSFPTLDSIKIALNTDEKLSDKVRRMIVARSMLSSEMPEQSDGIKSKKV